MSQSILFSGVSAWLAVTSPCHEKHTALETSLRVMVLTCVMQQGDARGARPYGAGGAAMPGGGGGMGGDDGYGFVSTSYGNSFSPTMQQDLHPTAELDEDYSNEPPLLEGVSVCRAGVQA